MNVVMTDQLGFVELQGTAEKGIFQKYELDEMLNLAQTGIQQLIQKQKEALGY
jgi:ribonuclease PH